LTAVQNQAILIERCLINIVVDGAEDMQSVVVIVVVGLILWGLWRMVRHMPEGQVDLLEAPLGEVENRSARGDGEGGLDWSEVVGECADLG
jgi:hypothetical protein